ncbi:MAG: alkaline phosphatase family protein, partial [Phenylobacterium sp.]|nr:alkaline phosphatase family protein [Phenylobacterium sp.]
MGSVQMASSAAGPVILISVDGFRSDYLDRGITPHMSALAGRGVRADMRAAFPTKTFPNHYTLVTGLRPDRHGLVDNVMQDP